MTDYSPRFSADHDITLTASADKLGGQLLEVSGPYTVQPTSGAGPKWIGTARQDAKAGERVVVVRGGVLPLKASGPIIVGARVIPATLGRVVSLGAGDATHSVGTAMTTVGDAASVLIAMDR